VSFVLGNQPEAVWFSPSVKFPTSSDVTLWSGVASGQVGILLDLTAYYDGTGSGAVGVLLKRLSTGALIWAFLPGAGSVAIAHWTGFIAFDAGDGIDMHLEGGSGYVTATGVLIPQLNLA